MGNAGSAASGELRSPKRRLSDSPFSSALSAASVRPAKNSDGPMFACSALGHYLALARTQQPGERRAAQIDDKVPRPCCDRGIKRQPM